MTEGAATRSLLDRLRGKKFGLALASGFFGFYHHAGILFALEEAGLAPSFVTGSSAGAIVGAMYAAGLSGPQAKEALLEIDRKDFWDATLPMGVDGFGLLAGERFGATLSRTLPVHRFEDCRVPLAVNAYDLKSGRVHHIDAGPLIPAVQASCAVPYLFKPVSLGSRRYWDGGFAEKTPLVPFLGEDLDAVLVSYLPQRDLEPAAPGPLSKLKALIPPLFADIPADERLERDREGARVLSSEGKEVFFLNPPRVSLGPFSLHKAPQAYEAGKRGAEDLLAKEPETTLPA